MPRPRSDNDTHVHIQLPGKMLEQAEALAALLNDLDGGSRVRAEVLRLALRRGLDIMQTEAEARRVKRRR